MAFILPIPSIRRRTLRLQAAALMLAALLAPVVAQAADVLIIRDRNHVPHVYGTNNHTVFYGFGYAMAEDRLFQMEMRKRQALGRTAEVLGPGDSKWATRYVKSDRQARLLMLQADVENEYKRLKSGDKLLLHAFTNGVNQRVREVLADQRKLPRPFFDYKFLPEEWTVYDTLAVAVDVLAGYASFSTEFNNLALYEHLRKAFPEACDDIFDQFLFRTDPNAPTTLRDHAGGGRNPGQPEPRGCGDVPNGLKLGSKIEVSALDPAALEPRRASMSWAVGEDMAKDAKAIMVSGPQPGWLVPSYYYPIGLHGGDFDLVGFAAETSFVLQLGVNRHLAWGVTAGLGHQVSHFQELRDKPKGERYFHKGEWLPFERNTHIIKVRGKPDEVFVSESTVHGVVVGDDDEHRHAYARAVAWQGAAASSAFEWVHAAHARSHEEWLQRARNFAFGLNWFYAGRDGKVGFAYTGRYPVLAKGHDHRLPASGTGEFDWQGLSDASENPWSLTPGYVVNFNNKPAKDWPNSGLYWEQWGEANQVNILLDAFRDRSSFDRDEMWDLNRIVSFTDVSARYFLPHLAEAAKNLPKESRLAEAVALMLDWNQMREDKDGDGYFDHPGLTLFDAWLPRLVQSTLGPTLKGFSQAGIWLAAGSQRGLPRLEEHPSAGTIVTHHAILSRLGKSGVHHHHDFFGGADYKEVMLRSLTLALTDLAKTYEAPLSGWKTRATPQAFFDTNTNRTPMTSPGLGFTLPIYANRGAMNMLVAYGPGKDELRAGFVVPPGQSAFIPPGGKPADNPHYGNHVADYAAFRLKPVYLDPLNNPSERSDAAPVELSIGEDKSKL